MKKNLYRSFLCIAVALFTTISILAQTVPTLPPEGLLYQAEARDNTGKLLTNKVLEVKLIIKQESSTTGLTVWKGEYTVNTDRYGLFSLIIGEGESPGYLFSDIKWALHEHFLIVQLMIDGIWETTGSLQFLSVPYAQHAGTAQSAMSADEVDWDDVNNKPVGFADNTDDVIDDDPDPTNEIQTLSLTNENLTISGEEGNTVTFTNWDIDATDDVNTTGDQIISGSKTFTGTTTVPDPVNTQDAATKAYVDAKPSIPFGTQTGEMLYWDGFAWVAVSPGNEGQFLTFTGGVPAWKTTQIEPEPEPEEGDIVNPTTGKVWMDKNLGASQVATFSSDVNAYGDLYQWGRAADGHESRISGITSTLSSSDTPGHSNFITNCCSDPYDWRNPQNSSLWQGVNGINNPCPNGYRLPTEAEWEAERASWGNNNAAGAFTSPLKLVVAGDRERGGGELKLVNETGYYWSYSVDGTSSRFLTFSSSDAYTRNGPRSVGMSVRCIKD